MVGVLYLSCFAVGLVLSVVGLFAGGLHVHGGHVHMGGHGGHVGKVHGGVMGGVPVVNAVTLPAFLSWFGGAGYLLRSQTGLGPVVVVLLALVSGFIGGALLLLVMVKVLLPHDRALTAEETRTAGVVGRLTTALEAGRTGELIYRQMGVRRSVPVRLEEGAAAMEKGTEAVVLRMEGGVGRVLRLDELAAASRPAAAERSAEIARREL